MSISIPQMPEKADLAAQARAIFDVPDHESSDDFIITRAAVRGYVQMLDHMPVDFAHWWLENRENFEPSTKSEARSAAVITRRAHAVLHHPTKTVTPTATRPSEVLARDPKLSFQQYIIQEPRGFYTDVIGDDSRYAKDLSLAVYPVMRRMTGHKEAHVWNGNVWEECDHTLASMATEILGRPVATRQPVFSRLTKSRSADPAVVATAIAEGIAFEWKGDTWCSDDMDEIFVPWRIEENPTDRRKVEGLRGYIDSHITVDADDFDTDERFIALENGYLDLETLERVDPDPEKLLTKRFNAAWKPGNFEGSEFQKFLNGILPDLELQSFAQRVFGAVIDPSIFLRSMIILHGSGRDGKSKLVEILDHVIGDAAVTVDAKALMGRPQSPADLMPLRGARLVTASESSQVKWDASSVKTLTGGDRLSARWMYSNPIEWTPTHTPVLSTNELPVVDAGDRAFWDRMIIVPFRQRFSPTPDYSRGEKLEDAKVADRIMASDAERSAVLEWLVDGIIQYRAYLTENGDGMRKPAKVLTAVSEAERDSSPFAEWAMETFYEDADAPADYAANAAVVHAMWLRYRGSIGATQAPHRVAQARKMLAGVFRVPVVDRTSTHRPGGPWGLRLTTSGVHQASQLMREQRDGSAPGAGQLGQVPRQWLEAAVDYGAENPVEGE